MKFYYGIVVLIFCFTYSVAFPKTDEISLRLSDAFLKNKSLNCTEYYSITPNKKKSEKEIGKKVWIKRKPSISIFPSDIEKIKIHRSEYSNTLQISIIINHKSKKLKNNFFNYTKRKRGQKIALLIEKKMIALLNVNEPISEAVSFLGVYNDIASFKNDFNSILDSVVIDDCTEDTDLIQQRIKEAKGKGDKFRESGNLKRALIQYTIAINLSPKNAILYLNRGDIYAKKGEYKKAISDFNFVIEKIALYDLTYYLRGQVWLKLKKYENAISDYNQAIKLNPTNEVYYNDLALLLATCEEKKFRNGDKAVWLAKQALRYSVNLIVYNTLAVAHAEAGNFKEAINMQKRYLLILKNKNVHKLKLKKAQDKLKFYEKKI